MNPLERLLDYASEDEAAPAPAPAPGPAPGPDEASAQPPTDGADTLDERAFVGRLLTAASETMAGADEGPAPRFRTEEGACVLECGDKQWRYEPETPAALGGSIEQKATQHTESEPMNNGTEFEIESRMEDSLPLLQKAGGGSVAEVEERIERDAADMEEAAQMVLDAVANDELSVSEGKDLLERIKPVGAAADQEREQNEAGSSRGEVGGQVPEKDHPGELKGDAATPDEVAQKAESEDTLGDSLIPSPRPGYKVVE